MKKLAPVLLYLLITYSSSAQNWFIDFESPQTRVWIDSNATDSLWQIGTPQKAVIDSAYSVNQGIITDTINPYPINANASFLIEFELGGSQPTVSFRHKFDMDSLHSAGFIEVSTNGGGNWATLYNQLWYQPGFGTNSDIDSAMLEAVVYGIETYGDWYNDSDTIFENQIGFTGSSEGWLYTTITFPCYAVKQNAEYLLKFTFVSDSLALPKDGWIIDDIEIDNSNICASINEKKNSYINNIYPNPSNENITIELTDKLNIGSTTLSVYDLTGRIITFIPEINSKYITLSKSKLGKGIFFIEIKNNNISLARKKIIFTD